MNDLLLLVLVEKSSSLLLSQFLQSIGRTSYLGVFVDGGAVMYKNMTSYLGKCVAAVCARACVFLPARVLMPVPLCLKT